MNRLEAVLVALGLLSGTCTFLARVLGWLAARGSLPRTGRVANALRTLGYDLEGFSEACTNPELKEFLHSFTKDQFESMLDGVLPLDEKQRETLRKLVGRLKS